MIFSGNIFHVVIDYDNDDISIAPSMCRGHFSGDIEEDRPLLQGVYNVRFLKGNGGGGWRQGQKGKNMQLSLFGAVMKSIPQCQRYSTSAKMLPGVKKVEREAIFDAVVI